MSENAKLIIPDKLRVGFQKREGTYTGKLAFVVYIDSKGVLRKERSWERWRHTDIASIDYDNVPTEGFVLNKGVGGNRTWGWHHRNEYIRVYDPRDFEFEISVANLLFILRECDCNKGKGLEGKFVYAWDRDNLVLLPVGCADYKSSKNFTELQDKSVKAKELIPGATYITKQQEKLTYLGRFEYFFVIGTGYRDTPKADLKGVHKRHVFWDGNIDKYSKKVVGFVYKDDLKTIATLDTEECISNFAELVDKYYKSAHGSRAKRLFTVDEKQVHSNPDDPDTEHFFIEQPSGGSFMEYRPNFGWNETTRKNDKLEGVCSEGIVAINNGVLTFTKSRGVAYVPGFKPPYWSYGRYGYEGTAQWVQPNNQRLYVELESGEKIRYSDYTFRKD